MGVRFDLHSITLSPGNPVPVPSPVPGPDPDPDLIPILILIGVCVVAPELRSWQNKTLLTVNREGRYRDPMANGNASFAMCRLVSRW